MLKTNSIKILNIITDIIEASGKFDFDLVLNGTYNFNVNDVSTLYELVGIIEQVSNEKKALVCMNEEMTVSKVFRYQFAGMNYTVIRIYNHDESTSIVKSSKTDESVIVLQNELFEKIEEKVVLARRRALIYDYNADGKEPAG